MQSRNLSVDVPAFREAITQTNVQAISQQELQVKLQMVAAVRESLENRLHQYQVRASNLEKTLDEMLHNYPAVADQEPLTLSEDNKPIENIENSVEQKDLDSNQQRKGSGELYIQLQNEEQSQQVDTRKEQEIFQQISDVAEFVESPQSRPALEEKQPIPNLEDSIKNKIEETKLEEQADLDQNKQVDNAHNQVNNQEVDIRRGQEICQQESDITEFVESPQSRPVLEEKQPTQSLENSIKNRMQAAQRESQDDLKQKKQSDNAHDQVNRQAEFEEIHEWEEKYSQNQNYTELARPTEQQHPAYQLEREPGAQRLIEIESPTKALRQKSGEETERIDLHQKKIAYAEKSNKTDVVLQTQNERTVHDNERVVHQTNNLYDKIEAVDRKISLLKTLENFLERIPQSNLERLLDGFAQREETRITWQASIDVRFKNETKITLKLIGDKVTSSRDESALDSVKIILKEFQKNNSLPEELSCIQTLIEKNKNASTALNAVRDKIREYEREGKLTITSLTSYGDRMLALADKPEIKIVWDEARKNHPDDYNRTRQKFWEFLHPKTEVSEPKRFVEAIKEGRNFIENAGYTFEASTPGNAPRIISDLLLTRNDYTLSIQHHLPQELIRTKNELKELLTDSRFLRFAQIRDNIHEDTIRQTVWNGFRKELQNEIQRNEAAIKELAKIDEEIIQDAKMQLKNLVKDVLSENGKLVDLQTVEKETFQNLGYKQFESVEAMVKARLAFETRIKILEKDVERINDNWKTSEQRSLLEMLKPRLNEYGEAISVATLFIQDEVKRKVEDALKKIEKGVEKINSIDSGKIKEHISELRKSILPDKLEWAIRFASDFSTVHENMFWHLEKDGIAKTIEVNDL